MRIPANQQPPANSSQQSQPTAVARLATRRDGIFASPVPVVQFHTIWPRLLNRFELCLADACLPDVSVLQPTASNTANTTLTTSASHRFPPFSSLSSTRLLFPILSFYLYYHLHPHLPPHLLNCLCLYTNHDILNPQLNTLFAHHGCHLRRPPFPHPLNAHQQVARGHQGA
jgi:hypothetical protein